MFGLFGKSKSKIKLIFEFLGLFEEMVEKGLKDYNNGLKVDLLGGMLLENQTGNVEKFNYYTKKNSVLKILDEYYCDNNVVDTSKIVMGYLKYDWFSGENFGGDEIENLLDDIKKLKKIVESDLP